VAIDQIRNFKRTIEAGNIWQWRKPHLLLIPILYEDAPNHKYKKEKRTAYPFGEASYAQRLPLGEGHKERS
jgi:hypothetical protein